MRKTLVFFRNDDVNRMEPGLREMTELLLARGVPVSHAVEPANLDEETRRWLLDVSDDGVEIIQHGYAHKRHDRGEFGGHRPAQDQLDDLRSGLDIMERSFGDRFFRAMSFPFGSYNEFTVPLLDQLAYQAVSCHRRHQVSRRVFYRLGRLLGRGRWMNRHVSHHLSCYPGTRLIEISVTISPIREYLSQEGPTACRFHDLGYLRRVFIQCRRQSPVVGIVLHHRYHAEPDRLRLLAEFVSWLKDQPGVEFADLEGVYRQVKQPIGSP